MILKKTDIEPLTKRLNQVQAEIEELNKKMIGNGQTDQNQLDYIQDIQEHLSEMFVLLGWIVK